MKVNRSQTHKYKPARKIVIALVVAGLFGVAGLIALRLSHAASFAAGGEAEDGNKAGNYAISPDAAASSGGAVKFGADMLSAPGVAAGLLQPYSMGTAPYAYLPYGDVTMADFAAATGVKNFFAAFILGSGCNPVWDGVSTLGLASSRSAAILNDINSIRGKNGDVALSFGGVSGTELANSCTNATQLQAAYQSVIAKYSLRHINFDLEGAGETDAGAMSRRVQAAYGLQRANPGLKVSLTLPITANGFDANGLNVVKKFHDGGVVLASIGIMAMDFGDLTTPQSPRVVSSAQATAIQLKQVYSDAAMAQIWKAMNIIVMIGKNDTAEVFALADARTVRDFALQNGVGTLSFWSANRDQPCGGTSTAANDNCSQISQNKYQFTSLLTIPAL